MIKRIPNPCLAKLHRTYTIDEAANLFGAHRNTIRNWIRNGLRTTDDRRPLIIRGFDLRTYLEAKRAANKRPCGLDELYCMRCRMPRKAAGSFAELQVRTETTGDLVAICSQCETMMYRRVSLAKISSYREVLDLTVRKHIHT